MDGNDDDGAIDAVIAWVDGSDPAHRAKLERTLAGLGIARPAVAHPTRFHHAGEIDWCLASILRFAPWIRRIHVVTDAQVPPVLQHIADPVLAAKLRLVDHREIFAGFEQYLPTFNSRAICSMLWRIPQLAERFVYFNDDMALLRPVRAEDFFRGQAMVVRGAWHRQSHASLSGRIANWWKRVSKRRIADSERMAQETSARLAGFDTDYVHIEHMPYPFRRSTMADYFARNREVLERDLAYPLRRPGQFRAECLSVHLEVAQQRTVFDNALRLVHLKPRQQAPWRIASKCARANRDPQAAFVCVQSLERGPDLVRERIGQWLDARIGRIG